MIESMPERWGIFFADHFGEQLGRLAAHGIMREFRTRTTAAAWLEAKRNHPAYQAKWKGLNFYLINLDDPFAAGAQP